MKKTVFTISLLLQFALSNQLFTSQFQIILRAIHLWKLKYKDPFIHIGRQSH